MVQHRIGRINHQLILRADLHAVVNIIKGDGQLLGKTAHLFEQVLLRHHAGRRHGAVILGAHGPVEVAVFRAVQADEGVAGDAAESDHHARMLDGIVLVEKSCAHGADLLPLTEAQHLLQEILRDQLGIIVQEQEILSLRKVHAEIVDGGIVELSLPADHPDIGVCLLNLLVIVPGFLLGRVVLHDHKFHIAVGGLLFDIPETGIQVRRVVLVRNDDGNQRISHDLPGGVVNAEVHSLFHLLIGDPHPVVVGHDGSRPRLEGVHLALRIAGRGILVTPPVIEHLRNMPHLAGLFGTPEDEIVILGAVKLLPESAGLLRQRSLDAEKMADIVYAAQEVRIEIRLEMGVKEGPAVHVQLVFVRIKHLAAGMFS